ncbi:MAG: universal stress protein [Candidatus Hydrogenedentes bacterium]|nr:universal stress protein [Candidatus Hydrogenedentota bacterium]
MSKIKNILVPTDFSPDAECALRYAKALAQATQSKLHFVHVITPLEQRVVYGVAAVTVEVEKLHIQARDYARRGLQEIANDAMSIGLEAEWHLRSGNVTSEVMHVAEDLGDAMMVVASHGRGGFDALVFGSTCEKLIRSTAIPVLVVKHPEHEFVRLPAGEIDLKHIVVPCDFSGLSKAALPLALSLAHRFGARITLVHVVEPHENAEILPELALSHVERVENAARQALEHLASQLTGAKVEALVRTGAAHREIVRCVEELDAGLVVMATHGRTGLSHMFFGSVTEKIIRIAPCPVLTIRPGMHASAMEGSSMEALRDASLYFG